MIATRGNGKRGDTSHTTTRAATGPRPRTPMGKSTGPTPEQCLQGSQSDVLPSEIREKELRRGQTLPVSTRLCTVTSDGNLSMLKITKVEKRATDDLPGYFTELTLWQQ
ncbi:hypothetical protein ACFTXM_35955 [Streptomyces sp. NPDC056930]|uniref:hypothetical protein n=1 Tax=Streptomyces sp. NPDC056930 TaxID=3345967 RepID=UPI003638A3B1